MYGQLPGKKDPGSCLPVTRPDFFCQRCVIARNKLFVYLQSFDAFMPGGVDIVTFLNHSEKIMTFLLLTYPPEIRHH